MSDTDTQTAVIVPIAEFEQHMRKVNLLVGVLSGVMNAMSVSPMFAAMLPPDLKAQIAALNEK